jgi:hypothetical protein
MPRHASSTLPVRIGVFGGIRLAMLRQTGAALPESRCEVERLHD